MKKENNTTSDVNEYSGENDMVTFEQINTPQPTVQIEQIGDDPEIRYRYDWEQRGEPTPEQFERVNHLEVKLAVMMTDLTDELEEQADIVLDELQALQRMMIDTRNLNEEQAKDVSMGNLDGLPEVEEL